MKSKRLKKLSVFPHKVSQRKATCICGLDLTSPPEAIAEHLKKKPLHPIKLEGVEGGAYHQWLVCVTSISADKQTVHADVWEVLRVPKS